MAAIDREVNRLRVGAAPALVAEAAAPAAPAAATSRLGGFFQRFRRSQPLPLSTETLRDVLQSADQAARLAPNGSDVLGAKKQVAQALAQFEKFARPEVPTARENELLQEIAGLEKKLRCGLVFLENLQHGPAYAHSKALLKESELLVRELQTLVRPEERDLQRLEKGLADLHEYRSKVEAFQSALKLELGTGLLAPEGSPSSLLQSSENFETLEKELTEKLEGLREEKDWTADNWPDTRCTRACHSRVCRSFRKMETRSGCPVRRATRGILSRKAAVVAGTAAVAACLKGWLAVYPTGAVVTAAFVRAGGLGKAANLASAAWENTLGNRLAYLRQGAISAREIATSRRGQAGLAIASGLALGWGPTLAVVGVAGAIKYFTSGQPPAAAVVAPDRGDAPVAVVAPDRGGAVAGSSGPDAGRVVAHGSFAPAAIREDDFAANVELEAVFPTVLPVVPAPASKRVLGFLRPEQRKALVAAMRSLLDQPDSALASSAETAAAAAAAAAIAAAVSKEPARSADHGEKEGDREGERSPSGSSPEGTRARTPVSAAGFEPVEELKEE